MTPTTHTKSDVENYEKELKNKIGGNPSHIGPGPFNKGETFLANGKTYFVMTASEIADLRRQSEDTVNNPSRGWNDNEGSVLVIDERRSN